MESKFCFTDVRCRGVSKPYLRRHGIEYPTVVMQHSDLSFPSNCVLMADADAVLKYLQLYAEERHQYTSFRTQVIDVRSEVVASKTFWRVRSLHLDSGLEEDQVFDAVIVANGRYNEPYISSIHGLSQWQEMYPGSISHSKHFQNAELFKDKACLGKPNALAVC